MWTREQIHPGDRGCAREDELGVRAPLMVTEGLVGSPVLRASFAVTSALFLDAVRVLPVEPGSTQTAGGIRG